MADVENFMGVSAGDIEKIMGVATGDIEAVMGLGIVTASWHGTRGVGGGGNGGINYFDRENVIQYKAVTSSGNCADFGDLSVANQWAGAVSNTTRGVFGGGQTAAGGSGINTIEYITVGSTGDVTDHGDLTAIIESSTGGGNGIRGLFHYHSFSDKQVDYITIASTGDAADFGDFSATAMKYRGAVNNSVRVLFAGGSATGGTQKNEIEYFTPASTGNATDFGNLTSTAAHCGGLESDVRGCWNKGSNGGAPGNAPRQIDYVTIASAADASDFGDMLATNVGEHVCNGLSNLVRGEWWGGSDTSDGAMDEIQYITIASTGNSTDAGNLTQDIRYGPACLSGT